MGRRDADHARSDVDKYRKQLGKHEFKGKSKRDTLAIRSKAQARKSESPLKDGLILLGTLVILMLGIYTGFYFYFSK
ncbi:triple QxxK/R motif-containing protein-like [Rhopilema esculentum]|uniref:triple QxxK/R motif-containing protein-like n=1 Tax=Rhopilema esculentum TaxID=499914 RepID=UPI0031DA1466